MEKNKEGIEIIERVEPMKVKAFPPLTLPMMLISVRTCEPVQPWPSGPCIRSGIEKFEVQIPRSHFDH